MSFLKHFCAVVFILLCGKATAQYAPAAGQIGSTAIYKDSSIFIDWATTCEVVRGPQDISNVSLGYASVGDSSMAIGIAGSNGVVSLGDGGYATLQFTQPIANGAGYDFAVFENGFSNSYLELAFVEVSSDGINFFRFPSHSLTNPNIQIGPFDTTDATKINNLAGKYRALYGTPFDLGEMANLFGLDIEHVTHVRIVDVVGSVLSQYASLDTAGNVVNDPWVTAFPSCGFDLDAIGVIHAAPNSVLELIGSSFSIFPNPTSNQNSITGTFANENHIATQVYVSNSIGEIVAEQVVTSSNFELSAVGLKPGIYFIHIKNDEQHGMKKWIIGQY